MMNPYADNQPTLKTTENLFGNYVFAPVKKRQTERGMLLEYFAGKIGKPIGFVAMKCARLSIEDLYYVKSASDSYEREGNPWGKAFYGMLKTKEVA